MHIIIACDDDPSMSEAKSVTCEKGMKVTIAFLYDYEV